MAPLNRTALIKKTLRVVRKHYKPQSQEGERTVLEHLLFACLLENSPYDAAERAFANLNRDYFDLNEVRVSTVKELSESFRGLVDAPEAAERLKRVLQSVFESVYAFDIEELKKQNIGQAVKKIEKYNGATPFVVAYVTQHALGGHAIPVNQGLFTAFTVVGVVSEAEAARGVVPGLERAVTKSKGIEAASLLHQFGVDVGKNPYGQQTRKLCLEIDPNCKDRLPKKPAKSGDGAPAAAGETGEAPRPETQPTKAEAKSAGKKTPKATAADKQKAGQQTGKGGDKSEGPAKKKLSAKKKTKSKKTATDKLAKRKPR